MIKHFRFILLLFVIVLLLMPSKQAFSQEGFYVQPFFSYQYVSLANRVDRLNKDFYHLEDNYFQYENTFKPAYGIRAIYNFTNSVGFESGLKYSQQGQKYKGYITVDGNTGDTVKQNYNSELKLNYLQIPLMLTFNSVLANIDEDNDKLYMSIAMGIQIDYLLKAALDINPGIDSLSIKYPNAQSEFQNLFHTLSLSLAGNVSLNWQMKHGWQFNTTLYAIKTIGDVENDNYKDDYIFDKSKLPLEYQFPVGIKKQSVSGDKRYKTKNVAYGLMLGVSYRLFQ